MVLRQLRQTEANWRVIVRLPAMRLRYMVVQRKEMRNANETAAGNQKKEIFTFIPPIPIKNQRPENTGKTLLTRGYGKRKREC